MNAIKLNSQNYFRTFLPELISCLVLLVYLSPYFIAGENARLLIHDNLDSNVVWLKVLAGSGKIFSPNTELIPNFMGGIPRASLGSEFFFPLWLYVWFKPFLAYSINVFCIHFIAFFGMRIFLKSHLKISPNSVLLIPGVSLAFSVLPFLPTAGISIAGLPLALSALLNFYHKSHSAKDWLILILIPFYSNFVFSFSFFLILAFCFLSIDSIRKKRINILFLIALSVFSLVFILVEYRLVIAYFSDTFLSSSRALYRMAGNLNLSGVAGTSFSQAIFGQYHASALAFPFILAAVLISFLLRGNIILKRGMLALLFLIAILSLAGRIFEWNALQPIRENITFLRIFTIRFYSLFPLLWFILFTLSLKIIFSSRIAGASTKLIGMLLIAAQVAMGFNPVPEADYEMPFKKLMTGSTSLSFKEYYDSDLFAQIQVSISLHVNDYSIVCLGFNPAKAQYNGFHTLDAYLPFYPSEYKKKFRSVIEKELDKNEKAKNYFDSYGGRCYFYSSELQEGRNKESMIRHLEVNSALLKEMGCLFIFSATAIGNFEELRLVPEHTFNSDLTGTTIYLYKLL